jgi:hypothetical protein
MIFDVKVCPSAGTEQIGASEKGPEYRDPKAPQCYVFDSFPSALVLNSVAYKVTTSLWRSNILSYTIL